MYRVQNCKLRSGVVLTRKVTLKSRLQVMERLTLAILVNVVSLPRHRSILVAVTSDGIDLVGHRYR